MNALGNKEIMAANIMRYLSLRGMTKKDLSREIGEPYTTVCAWCKAETYPRIDKIEKMATLFGINKCDLVEEYDISAERNTTKEKTLIRSYRQLNEAGQDEVMKHMKYLLSQPEYIKSGQSGLVQKEA